MRKPIFAEESLWDFLKGTEKPILLYGTGNGGDKILDALAKFGRRPDAVFASDGFVRQREFRGYSVRSYSDCIAEYGKDVVVLLAFGTTLPEVRSFIEELDKRHTLLIPDVPLYGGELFTFEYFTTYRKKLEKAASLLSDEESLKLFEDAVNFRLTGQYAYLGRTEAIQDTLSSLFKVSPQTVLDGGAFKGDSAREFIDAWHPSRIIAVEADPKTAQKLSEYAKSENRTSVIAVNAVLSDTKETVSFFSSASRGSGENGQNKRAKVYDVTTDTIDGIVGETPIDFIKLDVEGNEEKALHGAVETMKKYAPSLSVSLYHRTDDLFSLIDLVHSFLPEHSLYLRRVPCIPMWDLNLYAIKKERD